MDTTSFSAYRRASQQLSADNQATMDWADDTDFRLYVTRRELEDAIELIRSDTAAIRDAERTRWQQN
jgi:hypothetical protein